MAILSIVAVGLSCAIFVDRYLVREADIPVEEVGRTQYSLSRKHLVIFWPFQ